MQNYSATRSNILAKFGLAILVFVSLIFFGIAFGANLPGEVVTDQDLFASILNLVKNYPVMQGVVIAYAVIQIVIFVIKNHLKSYLGENAIFLATNALIYLSLVVGAHIGGLPWLQALLHGPALTALSALLYRVYELFLKPKANKEI